MEFLKPIEKWLRIIYTNHKDSDFSNIRSFLKGRYEKTCLLEVTFHAFMFWMRRAFYLFSYAVYSTKYVAPALPWGFGSYTHIRNHLPTFVSDMKAVWFTGYLDCDSPFKMDCSDNRWKILILWRLVENFGVCLNFCLEGQRTLSKDE